MTTRRPKCSRLRQMFLRMRGWWRLLHGFCPECNSSGPLINECRVCDGYDNGRSTDAPYPPSARTRRRWVGCVTRKNMICEFFEQHEH